MQIKEIANYCLKCKNPSCVKACPAHNNIPAIMQYVANEQYHEAYCEFLKTQYMPELCGKLCAQDHQCEGSCVRGIKGLPVEIGKVEQVLASMYYDSFVSDLKIPTVKEVKNVVVVGAGITGITTSIILAKVGLKVTLMEKDNCIGGTVKKYIPNFRFLSDTFSKYEKILKELDVKIIYNKKLGDNLLISELEEYDYQVICRGAQNPTKLWKEDNPSIISGLEILEQYNQNICELKNRNVIVIGAGNVAMDAARTLKRLNNNVTIVYRRTIDNSPASINEIKATKNEKVNIMELWAPIKPIYENNKLIGIQVQKMKLADKKPGQRQNVVPIDGAISTFPCDTIVVTTGASTDNYIFNALNIDKNCENYLSYYFGGDTHTGPKTIVHAMVSGKDIAFKIINNINDLHHIKNNLMDKKRKVFFGGSFNPPTIAHLNILKFLTKKLNAEVLLVPNGDDYHYHDKKLIDFNKRVDMLNLLVKDVNNVIIDKGESTRPFKGSVETLKYYHHPYFVIGADSLSFITTWIDAKKLIRQNKFIVFNRPGYNIDEIFKSDRLLALYRHHFIIVNYELGNASSTEFKKTFNDKLLTKEVYDYIVENELYKEDKDV